MHSIIQYSKPTKRAGLIVLRVRHILPTALLLLLLAGVSSGQTETNGATPLGLSPGSPAGSYALSGFDTVNLFNGHMNFRVSLLAINGRGTAGYQMTLPVEQTWTIFRQQNEITGVVSYYPEANEWTSYKPGYGPGVLQGRASGTGSLFCGQNSPWYRYSQSLTRLTFTAGDGTEFELRDQLTSGQPKNPVSCTTGFNRGQVFVTADGSAATFISDVNITDAVVVSEDTVSFSPSGYLLLRNGTRYRIDGGTITWMRDRNGNKLSFVYDSFKRVTSVTDSLNRQITIAYAAQTPGADVITYKGFGGGSRTISVNYDFLQNALRADQILQTPKQLFPDCNGSSATNYNPTVIKSVTLPNNQQYRLWYNSYGEVARAVLPTGGAIEYDYAAGLSDGASSGSFGGGPQGKHVYRRIIERRVYPGGGAGSAYESKMTYSRPETTTLTNLGYVITDQCTPSGTTGQCGGAPALLGRQQHYFYGSARSSFYQNAISYGAWTAGREYQVDTYDLNGTSVLQRTVQVFAQRALVSWWTGTPETAPPNDVRLTSTTTMIEPGSTNLVSTQFVGYDDTLPYNNQNNVKEYDFGTGTSGALMRETRTTYITSSNYTDALTGAHLRSLASQVSIYDGGGTERARLTTEYDNYTTDTNHAGLLNRASISGLDSSFTTSYTTRGNATANTQYLLLNGSVTGSVTSYGQYDIAGNMIKAIAARGNTTTIFYDDCFGAPDSNARLNSAPLELSSVGQTSFALPTKVKNAADHFVYSQFDYYLGKLVNGEDANGIVASSYFSDWLDRPTQIRRAVGTSLENQTTFVYDDLNRTITTSSDRDSNNDNLLVSKVLYDQMGRAIEKRQYEGGTNYIAIQTQYDVLGRAYKTSNPFRPWQSETAVWNTQAFDALGRVISVTTPDNAVVNSSYSGNGVSVTDQAGKARKSVTDALGRLTAVYEDPNASNYQTIYTYDVLDNLVKVTQGSQQRFFMYDSLKRLIRARNPEQSTYVGLNLSDPLTGNNAWSFGYQYDNNGNLTQRTDARGVISTYAYDLLNRNTTTDYSDTPSVNPDVSSFYDGATKGIGRFWYNYSGGNISVGSNVEHTAIDSYDAAGRPLIQRQIFKFNGSWGPTYQTSRSYNLAGSVISQTYPSGRSVTYSYDSAGRTSSFSGTLGDATNRTYSTGVIYSPFGGMTKEQFGTNTPLYHKSFYNIRGQFFDTRLSSVNDTWDWNRGRLILYYSSNHLWGQSGTDNNGNVRFAEAWIPPENATLDQADVLIEDSYNYDALNRLSSVTEQRKSAAGGWVWQQQFRQAYSYDRYGNRTIDGAQTWGTGINNKQFTVDANTNRLNVPAGQSGTMSYDAAGNLLNDTYSGAGSREYDAENRMTKAWGGLNQWQYYTYNADGQRTRRKIDNIETWEVYGFDGELLAEYPANGAASSPQKEYGYRNGQLLITASALVGHWRFDENSGTTAADSSGSGNTGTLTSGAAWGTGQSGSAASLDGADDYVQVGAQSSLVMTTAASFSAWIYPTGAGSNATYGGTILVKEGEYIIARFPNGTIQWGFANSNPGWNFINTGYVAPLNQWTHIAVTYDNGTIKTYANGSLVHTFNGSGVIGDSITGQNDFRIGGRQGLSQHFQGRIDDVRVFKRALSSAEVIALPSDSSSSTSINWLVTDHLGTPRMIIDQTGSLASVKRHDYLPFGEELYAGVGGRTTAQGYSSDNVRQKFTSKERDNETGLDYFGARYYGSTMGRFTSPDEPLVGQDEPDPQTWNLYSYTSNNPLIRVDEDGQRWFYRKVGDGWEVQWVNPNEDGSYTSPQGEGWKEHIPSRENGFSLIFYSADGYKAYYFGEKADGSPTAKSLWTGKVESKPDHILAAAFSIQSILNVARASFTAWQAAGLAAREEIKTVATQAGTTGVQQQVVKATAGKITGFTKHGINQAISRDGVGVATRAMADAVQNPIKVVAGKASTKYIGRDATVVLNKAGKVVTTWARNSAGHRIRGK